MDAKEIKALAQQSPEERYAYFIQQVAKEGGAWGLMFDEGWALAATEEDEPVFPLWPHAEFAQLCAIEEWADFEPTRIDLSELFEELLPSLKENEALLGIFYTPDQEGAHPSYEQFSQDLMEAMAK